MDLQHLVKMFISIISNNPDDSLEAHVFKCQVCNRTTVSNDSYEVCDECFYSTY